VALATLDVFATYAGRPASSAPLPADVPRETTALIEFLRAHGNDLTGAAIVRAPVVAKVLDALSAESGALLSRMSGSGSTCFALFSDAAESKAAAVRLGAAHKEWWVTPAVFR
jgi:4-diphosphocytidyl-2-C-methyl-D-erythritol kinase